jgi:4-hydroxy-tetrahydrodipicolinate synthase
LIERLISKYPGIVAGVKDSSGDWPNTKAMLDAFAKEGFDVFAGSEVFLLDNMRHGGKGCITATGNINPGPIANGHPARTRSDQGRSALRQRRAVEDLPPAAGRADRPAGGDAGDRSQSRGLRHARPKLGLESAM